MNTVVTCQPGEYTQVAAEGDNVSLEFRGPCGLASSEMQPAADTVPTQRFNYGDTFSAPVSQPLWVKPLGVFAAKVGVTNP